MTDSSEHIKYYITPKSIAEKDFDSLKHRSEKYIDRVLSLIHEKSYDKQISQFFVSSRLKMKELISVEANGAANWKYNAIYYVYGDSIKGFTSHEFNHVIALNSWGVINYCSWLVEGFAVYSDDAWQGRNLHGLCKYLLDNHELLSIETLRNNFLDKNDLITYPEAGSFVKYLYEKYGYQSLKRLWQEGEGKVENIYGKSYEELEKDWISIIKTYDTQGLKYNI